MKNRVKDIRMVRVGDLLPSEFNWRSHPPEQRHAMEAALREIGFAGAFVVREDEDGKLRILDGHLRQETLDEDEMVPVVVTDLDEMDAKKLNGVFDPIGALATADPEKLAALRAEIKFDSYDLQKLLDSIEVDKSVKAKKSALDEDEPQIIPEMELQPNEHYDYVLVLARNRMDWNNLCAKLGLHKVRMRRSNRCGIGRAVEATLVLDLLNGTVPDSSSKPKADH